MGQFWLQNIIFPRFLLYFRWIVAFCAAYKSVLWRVLSDKFITFFSINNQDKKSPNTWEFSRMAVTFGPKLQNLQPKSCIVCNFWSINWSLSLLLPTTKIMKFKNMCVVLEKGRTAPLWIRENNCFYLPLNLKYNSGLPSVDVREYSRNRTLNMCF